MEETIGYETFFSTEEWDTIESGTYFDVMAEAELEFGSVSPQGEEAGEQHVVSIYEQGSGFEIECELCGTIGEARSQQEAGSIKRLHESFVAKLVTAFSNENGPR